jgi:hypothetical protein
VYFDFGAKNVCCFLSSRAREQTRHDKIFELKVLWSNGAADRCDCNDVAVSSTTVVVTSWYSVDDKDGEDDDKDGMLDIVTVRKVKVSIVETTG